MTVMAKPTHNISYIYSFEGAEIRLTREHWRTAYARNGNVGNPTEYFHWTARVDGKLVTSLQFKRSEAYEVARAHILGIRRGRVENVRHFRVVEREMRANLVRKEASDGVDA